MKYQFFYKTPDNFSDIILESDGTFLTGLWFIDSPDCLKHEQLGKDDELPIFTETVSWLDLYFKGIEPPFTPKYKLLNLTPFRKEVTAITQKIPFGQTLTYNDIAKMIAKERGIKKMSAQAVGGALNANQICLIIPCHRVIGAHGNLTGYGGGIKNKIELLKLEGNDMTKLFIRDKSL